MISLLLKIFNLRVITHIFWSHTHTLSSVLFSEWRFGRWRWRSKATPASRMFWTARYRVEYIWYMIPCARGWIKTTVSFANLAFGQNDDRGWGSWAAVTNEPRSSFWHTYSSSNLSTTGQTDGEHRTTDSSITETITSNRKTWILKIWIIFICI